MEQQKEDSPRQPVIWGPAGSEGPAGWVQACGWASLDPSHSHRRRDVPFIDGFASSGRRPAGFQVSGRRCERRVWEEPELGAGGSGEDLVTLLSAHSP